MSPYNNNNNENRRDITGICTQWTSYPLRYDNEMKSIASFPLLQTHDSQFLIYKNSLLDRKGNCLMQWRLKDTGYAVAYVYNKTDATQFIIALNPDSNGNFFLSANALPSSVKNRNYLDIIWSNVDYKFSSNFQILVDEEVSRNVFVYHAIASTPSNAVVTALNIETGTIRWIKGLDVAIRGILVASKGRLFISFDTTVTALNATNGTTLWTSKQTRKLFSVIEHKDVVITSSFSNSVFYIRALNANNGTLVWSSQQYFAKLPANIDIVNSAQVYSKNCSFELLIERTDGIYTICDNTSGSTTGLYWSSSNPGMEIKNTALLSLGDGQKNIIGTRSSLVIHNITFYKAINQAHYTCSLKYNAFQQAIQDKDRVIYVPVEHVQNPEFRIIAFSTTSCKLFPNCPYFEITSTHRFKIIIGVICTAFGVFLCCLSICCCCCIRSGCCGLCSFCNMPGNLRRCCCSGHNKFGTYCGCMGILDKCMLSYCSRCCFGSSSNFYIIEDESEFEQLMAPTSSQGIQYSIPMLESEEGIYKKPPSALY
jgi:outer membrane protein assembly factor BamB